MDRVMRIYFPATCNILTPGHIRCIEVLSKKGQVIVGVLNSNALLGYKKEVVPFKDRKFILKTIAKCFPNVSVVSQKTLDPKNNLLKYKCQAIASGDGWEPQELETIKKLNIKIINIKLPGEKYKTYSSSNIIK